MRAVWGEPLKGWTHRRKQPLHRAVDGLPAHKNKMVKDCPASTNERLTPYFPARVAPGLNPGELVWSHTKRTGVASRPLRKGE